MNVVKRLEGSELFVEIEGNIDTVTAPDLNASLNESINGVTSIFFDFKNVMDIFTMTGFVNILTIEN